MDNTVHSSTSRATVSEANMPSLGPKAKSGSGNLFSVGKKFQRAIASFNVGNHSILGHLAKSDNGGKLRQSAQTQRQIIDENKGLSYAEYLTKTNNGKIKSKDPYASYYNSDR